eukprot:m.277015 g.277015  ORF g.277015 m.277015 type:complete len:106 (+) comp40606_c0_seq87:1758-2075(+)
MKWNFTNPTISQFLQEAVMVNRVKGLAEIKKNSSGAEDESLAERRSCASNPVACCVERFRRKPYWQSGEGDAFVQEIGIAGQIQSPPGPLKQMTKGSHWQLSKFR